MSSFSLLFFLFACNENSISEKQQDLEPSTETLDTSVDTNVDTNVDTDQDTDQDSDTDDVSYFGVDGFDYPVGTPISQGGTGDVTEAHDGDGYYNALDWGESWSTYYYHCGEDWNGEGGGDSDYGDPVYATADGFVTAAESYGGGWGNIITIEHEIIGAGDVSYEVIESQYAHLSSIFVSEGDWVNRGDLIGEIGDANGIYSAHLHFELRWDESLSAGGTNGYGCSDSSTGTFDPSEFIDSHRTWP